jgi:uncharacterized protein involved in type VI secretion and phage assembly
VSTPDSPGQSDSRVISLVDGSVAEGENPSNDSPYLISEHYGFSATSLVVKERLGRPFRVELEVDLAETKLPYFPQTDLIGTPISVQISGIERATLRGAGGPVRTSGRVLHAWVRRFERVGIAGGRTERYRVVASSGLWPLARSRNTRIFHDRSVPELVTLLVNALGTGVISVDTSNVDSSPDYQRHEQLVQYRESDLAFLHRLMEREGLTYYFAHERGRHSMVLTDEAADYPWFESGNKYDGAAAWDFGSNASEDVGAQGQDPGGFDLLDMAEPNSYFPERLLSFRERRSVEQFGDGVSRARPERVVLRGYEYNKPDDTASPTGVRAHTHVADGLAGVTDAAAVEPKVSDTVAKGDVIERYDHPADLASVSQAGGAAGYNSNSNQTVGGFAARLAQIGVERLHWPKRQVAATSTARALRAGSLFSAYVEAFPPPEAGPQAAGATHGLPADGGAAPTGGGQSLAVDLTEPGKLDFTRVRSFVVVASQATYRNDGGTDAASDPKCEVEVRAVPVDVPFRPRLRTRKPVLAGPQTATVVTAGGSADESETPEFDEMGRVTVRFHWARSRDAAESTPASGTVAAQAAEAHQCTAKVRVSQPLAGDGHGATFVPRIGHEGRRAVHRR